jgi:hypothetical protein
MKNKNISKIIFEIAPMDEKGLYYIITDSNEKLKTSMGTIVESSNYDLINTICDELNTMSELDDSNFSFYSIYSIEKDWIPENFNLFLDDVENMILADLTLKTCAGPERIDQMAKWSHLNQFLEKEGLKHPQYIQVPNSLDVKNWIYSIEDNNNQNKDYIFNHEKLVGIFQQKIIELTAIEKASIIALSNISHSIVYSYLIIKGQCNANEFAYAVFAGHSIHPKFYEDELNDNREFIDQLMKCGNAIKTYLTVGLKKSEHDTWKELESLRKDTLTTDDLTKIARIISPNIDYELFIDFLTNYNMQVFVTPTIISKLIARLAKEKNPESIAELCSGLGNISRFLVFTKVDAYEIDHGSVEVARKLLPNINFINQCILRDPIEKKYDLIISHVPFNYKFGLNGKEDYFENFAMKKGLELLTQNGNLIFIVPITFLYAHVYKKIREIILAKHHLKQIIELPKNLYKRTSIASAIVVINKLKSNKKTISSYYEITPEYINGRLVERGTLSVKQLRENWYIKPPKSTNDVKKFLSSFNIKKDKISLSEISCVINGYIPNKSEIKAEGEFLLLGIKNIKNSSIIKNKNDRFIDKVQNSKNLKSILQPGDILIAFNFDKFSIYNYTDNDPKAIASRNVKVIRSNDDYLGQYLKSPTFATQFKMDCKNKIIGTAVPQITTKALGDVEIFNIPLKLLIENIENLENESITKDSLINAVLKNIKDSKQKSIINEILDDHFEDPIIKLSKEKESIILEFKSSYRTNTQKPHKPAEVLQYEIVKAVAAFANTEGGDLLIGVSDNNKIIGIEIDNYKSTDEFIRTITRKLEVDIKPNPIAMNDLISISHTSINGKTIVRLNVKSAHRPLYAYKGGEKKNAKNTEIFYKRKPGSSESLSLRESVRYIIKRFPDYKF